MCPSGRINRQKKKDKQVHRGDPINLNITKLINQSNNQTKESQSHLLIVNQMLYSILIFEFGKTNYERGNFEIYRKLSHYYRV